MQREHHSFQGGFSNPYTTRVWKETKKITHKKMAEYTMLGDKSDGGKLGSEPPLESPPPRIEVRRARVEEQTLYGFVQI